MKKIILPIFLCVVLLLSLCFCSKVPKGWKTVEFSETSEFTFKIPPQWEIEEIDGLRYFTNGADGEEKVYYMFETKEYGLKEKNILTDNFKIYVREYHTKIDIPEEKLEGLLLSSGVYCGEAWVLIDDVPQKVLHISFPDGLFPYDFYVWDNNVSWETLKSIAYSVKLHLGTVL